jgi:hypothetical protein
VRAPRLGAALAAAALVVAGVVAASPASSGAAASRLFACSAPLGAPGPAGRPVAVSVAFGADHATLAATSGGGLVQVLSRVRVELRTARGRFVKPFPTVTTYLITTGSQVCLVAGSPSPSVVVLAFSGGAHCCYSLLGFVASRAGVHRALARRDLADFAALRADRGRVVVRSGVGAFAYTFESFAGSAEPILLESFEGTRFVDVTRRFPDLVTKDAATWWRLFTKYPGDLSYLAGWVADESLLGRGAGAWAKVAAFRAAGRLHGTVGYPSGEGFVRDLHALLRATGYPAG